MGTTTITIPDKKNDTDATIVIKGKSGRELTLGSSWVPKSGEEVKLGCIRLYEVIPSSVRRRLQRERKVVFENNHHRLIASIQQKLDILQSQIDTCSSSSNSNKNDDDSKKE